MLLKGALFLLLLFHSSSAGFELPQCQDVSLYYCYYNYGGHIQNAIPSVNRKHYVGITDVNSGYNLPAELDHPSRTFSRVLCSNHKESWTWTKKFQGWDKAPTDVSRINWHVKDGVPVKVMYNKGLPRETDKFLQLKCRVGSYEVFPKTLVQGFFQWQHYHLKIPARAIKGGTNSRDGKPFYIGLLKYLGKTYVGKIIPGVAWIQIIPEDLKPIYVVVARNVMILTGRDRSTATWEKVTSFDHKESRIGRVYKCKAKTEEYLTANLKVCKGKPTTKLVNEKPFDFDI